MTDRCYQELSMGEPLADLLDSAARLGAMLRGLQSIVNRGAHAEADEGQSAEEPSGPDARPSPNKRETSHGPDSPSQSELPDLPKISVPLFWTHRRMTPGHLLLQRYTNLDSLRLKVADWADAGPAPPYFDMATLLVALCLEAVRLPVRPQEIQELLERSPLRTDRHSAARTLAQQFRISDTAAKGFVEQLVPARETPSASAEGTETLASLPSGSEGEDGEGRRHLASLAAEAAGLDRVSADGLGRSWTAAGRVERCLPDGGARELANAPRGADGYVVPAKVPKSGSDLGNRGQTPRTSAPKARDAAGLLLLLRDDRQAVHAAFEEARRISDAICTWVPRNGSSKIPASSAASGRGQKSEIRARPVPPPRRPPTLGRANGRKPVRAMQFGWQAVREFRDALGEQLPGLEGDSMELWPGLCLTPQLRYAVCFLDRPEAPWNQKIWALHHARQCIEGLDVWLRKLTTS